LVIITSYIQFSSSSSQPLDNCQVAWIEILIFIHKNVFLKLIESYNVFFE